MNSHSGSPWDRPEVVAGFTQTPPNAELLRFAETEQQRVGSGTEALDLGCGAGRNAVPLAEQGWRVLGIDSSMAMLQTARHWARERGVHDKIHLAVAPMDRLPVRDRSCDLLVAHGIWNLARSGAEFRRAVHEAARVARPGAGLFVFTFSRTTLPREATPVSDEAFVFTQFSGQPQCFLTVEQLISALADASFSPDPSVPVSELNRSPTAALQMPGIPVIHQAAFRYQPEGDT
jgi:ubiquinone/menaquinone biosynthesis C-methylase UbiE